MTSKTSGRSPLCQVGIRCTLSLLNPIGLMDGTLCALPGMAIVLFASTNVDDVFVPVGKYGADPGAGAAAVVSRLERGPRMSHCKFAYVGSIVALLTPLLGAQAFAQAGTPAITYNEQAKVFRIDAADV